jgi:hypothetical protein
MPASDIMVGARAVLADALRAQLAREGAVRMDALGSSMEPTVPGGSVLRVERLAGTLAVDELVAFVPDRGALLCCHRVVAIDQRGHVLTQGDRHRVADGFARPDQVIGVVRSFELGGKTYAAGPHQPRPRPSLYRLQRQRLVRLLRRLRAL